MKDFTDYLVPLGQEAKKMARILRRLNRPEKDALLQKMATSLRQATPIILAANQKDITTARERGLNPAMVERLMLNEERIEAMAAGIEAIIQLPDPVGYVEKTIQSNEALQIGKQRTPIGVIGIIYESRPNVTADAGALCLKSGNAVILRGGREALESNLAIVQALQKGLGQDYAKAIQLIDNPDRQLASQFMQLNGYVDCLIPRGSAGLIQAVVKQATVPVIETGAGNCHLYVDQAADLQIAKDILLNGKVQRPSVCNALETLLVHEDFAKAHMVDLLAELKAQDVELRGCPLTQELLTYPITPASEEDYWTEFNDYILAIKVVSSYEEAIQHIEHYSAHHSEVIVTDSYQTSQRFLNDVDSAAVYVNASSRFSDGSYFGLGAEIGISTQKLHARGPMGLEALTTYKYIVRGNGQIRK